MKQAWENDKNLISSLILAQFETLKFPSWVWPLAIVAGYHRMQLIKLTCENGKISNFGYNLGLFHPNLGPKNFFRGFYLH